MATPPSVVRAGGSPRRRPERIGRAALRRRFAPRRPGLPVFSAPALLLTGVAPVVWPPACLAALVTIVAPLALVVTLWVALALALAPMLLAGRPWLGRCWLWLGGSYWCPGLWSWLFRSWLRWPWLCGRWLRSTNGVREPPRLLHSVSRPKGPAG